MTGFLDKVCGYYEVFCRILLLLMTSLVIIFVFMRYFFGITFVWAEEMITMLFISTTYFGAVIGMKYNEHIKIGFFYDTAKGKTKKVIDIINDIVILGLQIAITYISINWIDKVGNVLTNGLRIPIRFFYFMMPFSAVLIGLYCIFNIAGTISHWNEAPADGVV